ncbi:hypothetical protein IMX26_09600 [Clostridium sp. 'deep sea']|uniref:hypothetical protein n=1 Tax=Clostridium sp. 'deep sea' TaxID=2779445 RepID=UPI0018967E3F|nr:hypothetical protein [Clostridium sp. 'deep sea']QOR33756.1 hypothetical protein IMX26_09600 [Clostridium sp. 'deep sea']
MNSKSVFLVLTIVFALIIVLSGFIDLPLLKTLDENVTNWGTVMSTAAFAVAAVNLIRIHVRRIALKRKQWYFSLYLLIVMAAQFSIGLIFGSESEQYAFGLNSAYYPLSSTMYALLGLWIASAAYRAFTARSIDSTILLLSGAIVMIGGTSFGASLSPAFAIISGYLQMIPTAAASRGIMIGAGVGAIALGVRILMGIERGHLGGSSE